MFWADGVATITRKPLRRWIGDGHGGLGDDKMSLGQLGRGLGANRFGQTPALRGALQQAVLPV